MCTALLLGYSPDPGRQGLTQDLTAERRQKQASTCKSRQLWSFQTLTHKGRVAGRPAHLLGSESAPELLL